MRSAAAITLKLARRDSHSAALDTYTQNGRTSRPTRVASVARPETIHAAVRGAGAWALAAGRAAGGGAGDASAGSASRAPATAESTV